MWYKGTNKELFYTSAMVMVRRGDTAPFDIVTEATPNTPPCRAAPCSKSDCKCHVKWISCLAEGCSGLQRKHGLI
jgi:hypothetical protein